MRRSSIRALALVTLAAVVTIGASCSQGSDTSSAPGDGTFTFTTDTYTVAAGKERYLCYAKTLDEDLAIDRFDYTAPASVHHILLVRTVAPEPDGLSECDVLIRTTWIPLFGAGKSVGDVNLEAPKGAGYVLPKGTQILLQLHLLNSTGADVSDTATVEMRKTTLKDPSPIGIYAFGTNAISLDPRAKTVVTNDCTTATDVDLFAWWPHMHKLGTSISLQAGPTKDSMKEIYRLDPWDFNDQHMTPTPLHIPKDSYTRVTCSYDNTLDTTVTFGESSNDEMCYLVTFVTGNDGAIDGCVNQGTPPSDAGVPPNPDAGACGMQVPNSAGIGDTCTKGGNECKSGLSCSSDQDASSTGPGFCLKIGGCTNNTDCGGGSATCCAPAEGGGLITICMPEACRPSDCTPK